MISGQGFRMETFDPPGAATSRAGSAANSPEILPFSVLRRLVTDLLCQRVTVFAVGEAVTRFHHQQHLQPAGLP